MQAMNIPRTTASKFAHPQLMITGLIVYLPDFTNIVAVNDVAHLCQGCPIATRNGGDLMKNGHGWGLSPKEIAWLKALERRNVHVGADRPQTKSAALQHRQLKEVLFTDNVEHQPISIDDAAPSDDMEQVIPFDEQ